MKKIGKIEKDGDGNFDLCFVLKMVPMYYENT